MQFAITINGKGENHMARTGTANQQKCSHCGRDFNSPEELGEHEKNCKSK
jgi:hypothetical protein